MLRMDWYILRAGRDAAVAGDLLAAGIRVYRPMYRVEYWHPRKCVVVVRHVPLVPGYLLVGEPVVPAGVTRHRCSFLLGADGVAAAARDAEDLRVRCERGDFDVLRTTPLLVDVGARVVVVALGLVGTVVRRLRRTELLVWLDAGREVRVPQTGLEVTA
jgi:hypothetical protein